MFILHVKKFVEICSRYLFTKILIVSIVLTLYTSHIFSEPAFRLESKGSLPRIPALMGPIASKTGAPGFKLFFVCYSAIHTSNYFHTSFIIKSPLLLTLDILYTVVIRLVNIQVLPL